ncbi:MAG: tetratricopeptide repeat protein, partial [Chitinophagales bacterium]
MKETPTTHKSLDIASAKEKLTEAKLAFAAKEYDKTVTFAEQAMKKFEAEENWEKFKEVVDTLIKTNFQLSDFSAILQLIEYVLYVCEKNKFNSFVWICRLHIVQYKILFNTREYNKAIACLTKAQEIIESNQMNDLLLIENLVFQAKCYNSLQDYIKSRELLNKVKVLVKKKENQDLLIMIEFYNALAMLESMESNFLEAKQLYEKGYELCQPHEQYKPLKLDFLSRIGASYMSLGDYEKALNSYYAAVKGYEKLYRENPKDSVTATMLGVAYSQIGRLLTHLGDYTQAHYYHEKAHSFYERLGFGKTFYFLINLSDFGTLYEKQKNYTKQVEYCEQALEISQNEYGDQHFNASRIYSETAGAYLNLGNMAKALVYYEKALAIDIQSKGEDNSLTLNSYQELGEYWTVNKKYEKGLEYYHKALKGFQNIFGNVHISIASTYKSIADNLRSQGKLKRALVHYQLAIVAFLNDYQETDFYQLPNVEQCVFLPAESFLKVLRGKGETLHEYTLFLEKTQVDESSKALDAGLNTCQLAADYLQQLQKTIKAEDSKLIFVEKMIPIYQLAIELVLLQAHRSRENSILEKAFAFHEQAKALLLRSSMQENAAKMSASIDSDLLEKEQELKNRIEVYLQKIQIEEAKGEQKNKANLKQWKQKHFNETLKHQALIEELETDYPEYYQLKYKLQSVSLDKLQASLDEQTIVLSYSIGIEKGYIFALSADDYQVISLDLPPNFNQQIKDYLNTIHAQNFQAFTEQSHALYCLLIQPLADFIFDIFDDELKKLVIIPDASLQYLPFETLIGEEVTDLQSASYHELDYLLNHSQIQYHYSTTLYHQYLQKSKAKRQADSLQPPTTSNKNNVDFMGFAPIYTSDKEETQAVMRSLAADYSQWATRSEAVRGDNLTPLPFSEEEVENIEGLFAQKGLKGQSLLYDTA